jgi:hypothetical protein
MVTYGHHPSALAASRFHQQEWFQNSGGPARTRLYTSGSDVDAGWSLHSKQPPRNYHMEEIHRAAQRTEEFKDRRYRNYLMREGSTGEIFRYFSNRL